MPSRGYFKETEEERGKDSEKKKREEWSEKTVVASDSREASKAATSAYKSAGENELGSELWGNSFGLTTYFAHKC